MESPKVLIISSVNPLVTAGRVALDYYKAFVQMKINVDFLTLLPVEDNPEIKYISKKPNRLRNWVYNNLYRFTGLRHLEAGHYFFYTYEQLPPVPTNKILKKIDSRYDLILIMFWQGMLSFKSILDLYDAFHCQIHFMGVDYSQMSGGCHFTGNCLRYKDGCGICPAIYSDKLKDFTYYNVRYRENVYKKVRPIVYGNTYMRNSFYSNSYLLKNVRVEQSYDIYNLDEFRPMDKKILRKKYDIPDFKRFVIFFGCQSLDDPRKGIIYLINSLSIFWDHLSESERNSIQVIVAGKQFFSIKEQIRFDSIDFGFVSMSQIPELYAMADVYLSPTVNDAGPMMVNQSLSCGTPVVAFEMGTAIESIKGKSTGYCARIRDAEDFEKGIEKIFRLSDSERSIMSSCCRKYALNTFSYQARVGSILKIYEKYRNS